MQPKELVALAAPLLRNPQVRSMYDAFRQMVVQSLTTQGFTPWQKSSAAADVFGCQNGAELLGWDELFDPHTQQMMLLSLTLSVQLEGPAAGLCRLTVRICYPDSFQAETTYHAITFPATPGFDPTESALAALARQVLARTSDFAAWLSWEAADFVSWLEQETTP